MKLLIITQTVDRDDPILGFFHRWIKEFAKHAETVTVFALRVGSYDLPANVTVVPLRPKGDLGRARTALRLITLSWKHRAAYNAVFVHMNMEHILAAGWLWHFFRKRVALWYTHGTVSLRLRLALLFTQLVFTASDQSMRVRTSKKRVMGHGMDLAALSPVPPPASKVLSFLTVGRVSPVKQVDLLIDAVAILAEQGVSVTLRVAGDGDAAYLDGLRMRAKERGISGQVEFLGPVKRADLPGLYRDTHIFLHASATGSLDKAALEALTCGVPVVTTNEELGKNSCPAIFLAGTTPEAFSETARKVIAQAVWSDLTVRDAARTYIEERHDLSRLVPGILEEFKISTSRSHNSYAQGT